VNALSARDDSPLVAGPDVAPIDDVQRLQRLRLQAGMFESALAVFTLPRHRQIMRGYLSRAATRDGDLDAAEAWLAPCDTRSDDLHTDSAWRISRAYLDTAREVWGDVLEALADDLPIADHSVPLAVLLRANAWEKHGDLGRASAVLREAMAKGVGMRRSLETIGAVHAEWGLCRRTFQAADAAHTAKAAAAAGGVAGSVGGIFYWTGLAMLAVSLVCVVLTVGFGAGALLGVVPLIVKLKPAVTATLVSIGGVSGTLAFVFAMFLPATLPVGAIFSFVGYKLRQGAKKAQRLRLHGIRGTAEVVGLAPTGMSVNDVPQMEIRLRVRLPDVDPYEAKTRMLLAPHLAAQFAPGVTVPVRADPDDHREFAAISPWWSSKPRSRRRSRTPTGTLSQGLLRSRWPPLVRQPASVRATYGGPSWKACPIA